MTEDELRSLIGKSEKEGFRQLFLQYKDYVYSIVWGHLRYVGSVRDAEECVSDVFADIFLDIENISEGSLKAYIGTVAKRSAIDRYRKLAGSYGMTDDSEKLVTLDSGIDIEHENEILETHKLIFEKICSLGEPDSTIIIHKFYYDRNSKDIAKKLDMTPTAVRVRLARALKRLRRLLSNDGISLH